VGQWRAERPLSKQQEKTLNKTKDQPSRPFETDDPKAIPAVHSRRREIGADETDSASDKLLGRPAKMLLALRMQSGRER
jgi:hypothetical protein